MIDATVSFLVGDQPWFAFALDLWLKSVVLCLAALAIAGLCGRRGVLTRSLVLYASLIGLTLLPAAALVFPQWRLQPWQGRGPIEHGVRNAEHGAEQRAAAELMATERGAGSADREAVESPLPTPNREAGPIEFAATPQTAPVDWRTLALFGYGVVVVGAIVRLLLSLAAVARLQRAGTALTEAVWRERLAHWRQRLGLRRPVRMLQSNQIDVPVVIGWRRPAILVPERLATSDVQTVDAVLLHELAHVRRGDYGWNLLLRLVQAFYWANPLVWLVGLRIARVREQACDEVCIHWLGGAENYRATLVELAGALLRRPLAALGMAMANSSRLQRRLEQLDGNLGRAACQSSRRWRIATLAAMISIAGALGGLKITSNAAAKLPERVRIVIDKEKIRTDEIKTRKNLAKAAVAVALVDPPDAESAEPLSPISPATQTKKDQAQPSRKRKPGPGEASNEDAGGGMPAAEPIKVRVEKVRREDYVVRTSSGGTLKAAVTTPVYARVAGRITARRFNIGDLVKAGQLLAEIETLEIDDELEQAQASVAQAAAALPEAEAKAREAEAATIGFAAELEKAESDKTAADAELEYQTKSEAVVRAAYQTGQASQEAMLAKEKALRLAKIAVGAAEPAIASAKASLDQSRAGLRVAQAGLQLSKLRADAARNRLDRLQRQSEFKNVLAPVDGIVTRADAELGSPTTAGGKPLFVITSPDRVIAVTMIQEEFALLADPGDHARVWIFGATKAEPYEGKISRVAYELDPKHGLPVEIMLDNAEGRLRPGMNCQMTIDLETHPDTLTIPMQFERPDDYNSEKACFRVVDGRAVKTSFSISRADHMAKRLELKSGLEEGDLVITQVVRSKGSGAPPLADGDRVEIVDNDSADDDSDAD